MCGGFVHKSLKSAYPEKRSMSPTCEGTDPWPTKLNLSHLNLVLLIFSQSFHSDSDNSILLIFWIDCLGQLSCQRTRQPTPNTAQAHPFPRHQTLNFLAAARAFALPSPLLPPSPRGRDFHDFVWRTLPARAKLGFKS